MEESIMKDYWIQSYNIWPSKYHSLMGGYAKKNITVCLLSYTPLLSIHCWPLVEKGAKCIKETDPVQCFFTGILFLELSHKIMFSYSDISVIIYEFLFWKQSSLENMAHVCYFVPEVLVSVRQSMWNKSKSIQTSVLIQHATGK